jgi:hypothetical protein
MKIGERLPIMLVQWMDSSHLSVIGWASADDVRQFSREGPHICESVGFVVSDTKKALVLAESIDEQGHLAELIKIPAVNITKRVRLRGRP